mmetsp:Transcript_16800/g.30861  ORF Transcript_16800/g.30861 Transcript_16800/m.30861 type:complete len:106 (+) Transcript_16800:771-1088(+)
MTRRKENKSRKRHVLVIAGVVLVLGIAYAVFRFFSDSDVGNANQGIENYNGPVYKMDDMYPKNPAATRVCGGACTEPDCSNCVCPDECTKLGKSFMGCPLASEGA